MAARILLFASYPPSRLGVQGTRRGDVSICPALLDVVGRGIWVLPRSTSCRNFTLTSREKRPPQVADIGVR